MYLLWNRHYCESKFCIAGIGNFPFFGANSGKYIFVCTGINADDAETHFPACFQLFDCSSEYAARVTRAQCCFTPNQWA